MPKSSRRKRVADATTDSFRVVDKAPNGEAQPHFDTSRNVWVSSTTLAAVLVMGA